MTFQFDTSGEVYVNGIRYTFDGSAGPGPHLSPFVQGYVEASARELQDRLDREGVSDLDGPKGPITFAMYAPETLARIMEDCARALALGRSSDDAESGARFWQTRQNRLWGPDGFPRLTPYLGGDGKVYLREGAPTQDSAEANHG